MKKRSAIIKRKTSETDIAVVLTIDGKGQSSVQTGIPFLDHMLTLLAKHGLLDLKLKAKGDLEVDIHHTNEDTGIALGQALAKALGNKKGIRRYGSFAVPMDEALIRCTLDISSRPSFYLKKFPGVRLTRQAKYTLDDAADFLRSFCQHAGINMHIGVLAGEDTHHIVEGIFKALAKALDMAMTRDPRVKGIPSTKGKF
ncbi:MAG: Imidazoleglycerol-phosphate dehydratase [Candidatus Omnitrophica bacterium ADurb.Bin292]|jgi:imidazoleglycerol-phosphate dehydratase|nr:MAG: Imidazoleglycerol-phosphate dehydratase [Candidatus Omnitrophica bacterium ADurb.Bin292]HPW76517.1 imidazoleglycerol-phosphate dehydratase HisB [Candidatus Omnitrophota bacterium]